MTRQNLTILHLSDFHLSHNNIDKELYDKMLSEIKNWMEKNNKNINYVFLTGDIVNQADFKAYSYAKKLIDSICKQIYIDKKQIYVVPGNHDVDCKIELPNENLKRDKLREAKYNEINLIENQFYYESINELITRQNKFYNFLKSSKINNLIKDKPYIYNAEDDVAIIGLNSSIFSSINDYRNQIYFLKQQYDEIKREIVHNNSIPLKVLILTHHPIDYFEENTKNEITEYARLNNAFIFSGHAHEQAYEKIDRNSTIAHQFWCGGFANKQSFNIVDINYNLKIFKLYIGTLENNQWEIKDNTIEGINSNLSKEDKKIYDFILKISDYPKRKKIKALWSELFDSPILKFEDYWNYDFGLNLKVTHRQLKRRINKHNYSHTECILLAKWFARFNIDEANDLFDLRHSDESYLYNGGKYKYNLFCKVLEVDPDILRTP